MTNSSNNQTLQLDLITIDNSLNPRVGALDQEKVVEYREHLDSLPPMHVFEIDGGYILAAGFHRIAAHRLAGRDSAEFMVHQGTREEAAEFADLDNLSHGINLTREEKRAVAERQLCRHSEWADSRIARSCYTTDKTIRKIREELEAAGRIEVHDRLVGSDGVERPRNIERAESKPGYDERLAEELERWGNYPDPNAGLEARVAEHRTAGSSTPLTDAVNESPDNEALLEDPDLVAAIDEELEEAGLAEEDNPRARTNAQLDALAGKSPEKRAADYFQMLEERVLAWLDEQDTGVNDNFKIEMLDDVEDETEPSSMGKWTLDHIAGTISGDFTRDDLRQACRNIRTRLLQSQTPLQRAAEMTKPIGTPPAAEQGEEAPPPTIPPKPDPKPAVPPPPPPPPPVVSDPPLRISITIQPGPDLPRRAVMLSLAEGDDAEPVTAGVSYREMLPRLQMMLEEHFNRPAPPPPSVSEPAEDVPEASPEWLVAK